MLLTEVGELAGTFTITSIKGKLLPPDTAKVAVQMTVFVPVPEQDQEDEDEVVPKLATLDRHAGILRLEYKADLAPSGHGYSGIRQGQAQAVDYARFRPGYAPHVANAILRYVGREAASVDAAASLVIIGPPSVPRRTHLPSPAEMAAVFEHIRAAVLQEATRPSPYDAQQHAENQAMLTTFSISVRRFSGNTVRRK